MQHRPPRPTQHRPAQERIVVDNLCYAYNGVVALHDVSLRAYAGSICALVGMNGAGKSTLFKALMGFVRPSRGTIAINGVPLREALRQQAVALRWAAQAGLRGPRPGPGGLGDAAR